MRKEITITKTKNKQTKKPSKNNQPGKYNFVTSSPTNDWNIKFQQI